MAALSANRAVEQVVGVSRSLPVKGAVTCYQGGLAVMDGAFVKPGVSGANLRTVGIFDEYVANAGADGAVSVSVRKGTFKFANHADNTVTNAHVGSDCYVEDDQTVGSLATAKSAAGKVFQVDADGVWVTLA